MMQTGTAPSTLSRDIITADKPSVDVPASVDASEFRAAMRQLASGVTVVTSGTGPRRRGITATAVCSLSISPPALIVCMNKDSQCHRAVLACGFFCVNILGAEHEPLAHRFAGHDQVLGAARFRDEEWTELSSGAPALRGAVAIFDCALRERLLGGTHSILIGHVAAARADPGRAALLYRSGAFFGLPTFSAA